MSTPDEAPSIPGWTPATEVAEELGVSRQTVNEMFKAGEFKTLHRLGKNKERKPIFAVKTSELEKIKESRSFPRSKAANAAPTDSA